MKINLYHLTGVLCMLLFSYTGTSQGSIMPNANQEALTLTGANGCNISLAYNPTQNVYYTKRYNYVYVHNGVNGVYINSHYDYSARVYGIWWNATTSTLEGNSRYSGSWWETYSLNSSGVPTSNTHLFSGSHTPGSNYAGTLDHDNNEVIFYLGSTVYRYNRSNGAYIGTVSLNTSFSSSNASNFAIGYTGISGKEYVIYDYVARRAYFYNKANGAEAGYSQLPASAPTNSSYGMAYVNGKLWLYASASNSWWSYSVINFGIQTSTVTGPFCDGSSVSVNFVTNGLTFNTGNTFTAQLSDANGNFSSPITLGTVTSTTAQTITGTIPASTPFGNGYRIRVVSSNPSNIGISNGTNININVPAVNLGPDASFCPNDSVTLTGPVGASTYVWSTGTTSPNEVVFNAGTYSLTVSNGVCSAADTVVLSHLTSPSISLSDTINGCGANMTLNAGSGFSGYAWSTGGNSATTTVSYPSSYSVTVTGTNNCTNADTVYARLVNPTINNGADTTICAGDSVLLQSTATSCLGSVQFLSTGSTTVSSSSAGDDNAGVVVTPNYVYYTGDNYTARYSPDLTGPASIYSRKEGLFSDLANGDLYTFWNSSYSSFYDSYSVTNNINQIRKLDESLNEIQIINLSTPISATDNSGVFVGVGFVLLYSVNNNNIYKIDLPSGVVTNLGNHSAIYSVKYATEGWASYGVAECNGASYNLLFRAATNTSYGTNANTISRYNLSTQTFNNASSFNVNLGQMAAITVSPWNNRWYFQHEYSSYFGSSSENIGYADVQLNYSGIGNYTYAWSSGQSTNGITVSPSATTNYMLTVTSGTQTCSDTVAVTVNTVPSIALSDTVHSCNIDSVLLSGPSGTGVTYAWSNGATTQNIYAKNLGKKYLTVTSSNGCSASDSTFVNLLDARIDQVDTTICTSDSIQLSIRNYCGAKLNNVPGTGNAAYAGNSGDDRGGIAATPNFVYRTGDSYTSKYNASTLSWVSNYSVHDGLFSDAAGKLYSIWNGTGSNYNGFNSIDRIIRLNENLQNVGTIMLSQLVLTGNSTIIAPGDGYLVLLNASNQAYEIDLASGLVTFLGTTVDYSVSTENWARWGFSECIDGEKTIVYRTSSLPNNRFVRHYISSGVVETVYTSSTGSLGDMGSITLAPYSNRIYFSLESNNSGVGVSYGETVGYFDANFSDGYGGNTSTSVLWSTTDTTLSLYANPSSNTNYSVTVSNGSLSCSDTVSISTIASPVVSLTQVDNSCYGSNTGSASLAVSGGVTPYSYNWSSSDTTSSISNLAAGDYVYSVTGGNGCVTQDSVMIAEPDQLLASVTINQNASCANSTDGSATLTVSGGTSPYVVTWPDGTTGLTNANLTGGVNNVVITDANACADTQGITVPSPIALPNAGPITSTSTFACPGTNTTLVASNGVTTTQGSLQQYNNGYYYLYNNQFVTLNFSNLPTNISSDYEVVVRLRGGFTDVNEDYVIVYIDGDSVGVSDITTPSCFTWVYDTIKLAPSVVQPYLSDGSIQLQLKLSNSFFNSNSCGTPRAYFGYRYYYGGQATYWFDTPNPSDTSMAIGVGTSITVVPNQTQKYYAAVGDGNCLSPMDSITITVPPTPTLNYSYSPAQICIGDTQTVTVTGAVSYIWPTGSDISSSSNSAELYPATSKDFVLTVTDIFNCQHKDTISVNVFPTPQLNVLTSNPTTCSNSTNGSAAVYGSGGASPYTYTWPTGATGALQLNLSAGPHLVTITDANGCSDTGTVIVAGPTPIAFNATVNQIVCNGNANGSVTLNASGGNTPYTYVWSTGSNSNSISSLTPGTYTVTITDNTSCTNDTTITITQPASLIASISGTTPESCSGLANGAATLAVVGGTTPYAYSWSNGTSDPNLSGVSGGTYGVTVTDANGCTAITSATITTTPSTLSANIQNVVNNLCFGNNTGSASVVVSGGAMPYTYAWSGSQNTAAISNLIAGTYSVTVTDNNLCQVVDTVTITHPDSMTIVPTVSQHVTCGGLQNGQASVAITGGTPNYNYVWSNGGTGNAQNSLAAGNYVITVTDANACVQITSVTVNAPVPLQISLSELNNVSCNGQADGKIKVIGTGGTAPYSYLWSTSASQDSIVNLAAGTYTVTLTDNSGCTKDTMVSIIEPIALTSSITSTTSNVCFNGIDGSATVTVSGGTAPYTYTWSNSANTASISNLAAGTYTMTATDANGCTTTSQTIITQPTSALVPQATVTAQNLCQGQQNGSANVVVTGGDAPYTYAWSNGDVTTTIQNLAGGIFTVSVTDANGCVKTDSVVISSPSSLSLNVASQTNVSCFGGDDGQVIVQVSGGATPYLYSWTNGTNSDTLDMVTAGVYTLTATDQNGCFDTVQVNITEPTALSSAITNSQNVACNGAATGFAKVSVSGGTMPYNYLWSNNNATDSISGVAAGFYSVTVTDAQGCTDTVVVNLSQPTSLSASVASTTDNICYGDSLGSATVAVTGGNTPYTINWPVSGTGLTKSALWSGAHIVTVTDNNGCIDTTLVNISEPAQITAPASIANVGCNGDTTGSIDITPVGGTGTLQYAWSSGESTEDLSNKAAGFYEVTITDANNCVVDYQYQITEPTVLVLSATVTAVSCFGDSNGVVNAVTSGATTPYSYAWSNGDTTGTINNLVAGTYLVTVTDGNGCTDTTSAVVGNPQQLTSTMSLFTEPTCYGGNNGQDTVFAQGGTAPYVYSWNNGGADSINNMLSAGWNFVTITDNNSCVTIDSVLITEPTEVLITLDSIVTPTCNGGSNGALYITPSGGTGSAYTYAWYEGSNTYNTEDVLNAQAGVYVGFAYDANGCHDSVNYTVNEPAVFAANTINQQDVNCNGDSTGWATISVSGGTGNIDMLWPSGQTGVSDSNLAATTYVVTLTDENNCTGQHTVTITEPLALAVTDVVTDEVCEGDQSGGIILTSTGGVGPYAVVWSGGQTGAAISGIGSGEHSYTLTDNNGCQYMDTLQVGFTHGLVASNLPDSALGCGASVGLNAGGGFSNYLWSTGGTGQVEQVSTSSLVYFEGTYGSGCTTYDTTLVTIVNNPIEADLGVDTGYCAGGSVNLNAGTATTYNWSTGGNAAQETIAAPGIVSVTVTDSYGCQDADTVLIEEYSLPVVDLGADTVICSNVPGASIDLDAGAGFVSYDWSTGETSQIITITTGDEYSVVVIDGNGCRGSDTILVSTDLCDGIETALGEGIDITVYPNPTRDKVTLNWSSPIGEMMNVSVVSLTGQVQQAIEIKNAMQVQAKEIDLSSLAQGVYLIRIEIGGNIQVNRITKL